MITQILEQAGQPVERNEVVQKVLDQRHVSENTILINLQDKKKFTRVGKSAYVVAATEPSRAPAPAAQADESDPEPGPAA